MHELAFMAAAEWARANADKFQNSAEFGRSVAQVYLAASAAHPSTGSAASSLRFSTEKASRTALQTRAEGLMLFADLLRTLQQRPSGLRKALESCAAIFEAQSRTLMQQAQQTTPAPSGVQPDPLKAR